MMYTQPHPRIGLRKLINFCLTLSILSLAVPLFSQFLYQTNTFSDNVSAYKMNASTGALTPVPGSPFATGHGPQAISADPTGSFLYVLNDGFIGASGNDIGSISAYTINAASGALTEVAGSPFDATVVGNPASLAVHPSGKFVYASGSFNEIGVIAGYAIDGATGALSPVSGSPFFTQEAFPFSMAVDPTGRFAYVVNFGGALTAFSITASTGALTLVGPPFAIGTRPASVAVDPTGRFVYVANSSPFTGSIYGYAIDPSTILSPIVGSPFATGQTVTPVQLTVSPTGRFVYVSNNFGAGPVTATTATGYAINAITGALTPIPGSPFPIIGTSASVDPTGKFVYFALGGPIGAYTIDATTGDLTPVTGSPFAGNADGPIAITAPARALLSVSVTPNSGSGASQTFAFQYSDSHGFASLTNAYAGFGATAYGDAHTCRVEYLPGRNQLFLKNDEGTAFMGPVMLGVAGTLSNSQCTLDAGKSSVSGSGDILTLNLAFSFKPTFVGMRGIFSYAIDKSGLTTPGRQKVGTWDVTP
jgi:6-phosphogluconolactonase